MFPSNLYANHWNHNQHRYDRPDVECYYRSYYDESVNHRRYVEKICEPVRRKRFRNFEFYGPGFNFWFGRGY